jgi:hypothetical protein
MFTIGKCNLTRHDLPLLNRLDESIISGARVLNPEFKAIASSRFGSLDRIPCV